MSIMGSWTRMWWEDEERIDKAGRAGMIPVTEREQTVSNTHSSHSDAIKESWVYFLKRMITIVTIVSYNNVILLCNQNKTLTEN